MTSVRGALIGAVLARPRPGPRLGNVVMLGLRTGAGAEGGDEERRADDTEQG